MPLPLISRHYMRRHADATPVSPRRRFTFSLSPDAAAADIASLRRAFSRRVFFIRRHYAASRFHRFRHAAIIFAIDSIAFADADIFFIISLRCLFSPRLMPFFRQLPTLFAAAFDAFRRHHAAADAIID